MIGGFGLQVLSDGCHSRRTHRVPRNQLLGVSPVRGRVATGQERSRRRKGRRCSALDLLVPVECHQDDQWYVMIHPPLLNFWFNTDLSSALRPTCPCPTLRLQGRYRGVHQAKRCTRHLLPGFILHDQFPNEHPEGRRRIAHARSPDLKGC
jgi:hypothetical protein